MNILIIEDEEKIARFVELELLHEGYTVSKAADGRAGLELAETGNFDLILLDIMLPELSGLEVLRRLRKTSQVPVIMLTARDAVMDKVSGLDMGADDYITKPFAIEELLARIRVTLKKAAQTVQAIQAAQAARPQPNDQFSSVADTAPHPSTGSAGAAAVPACPHMDPTDTYASALPHTSTKDGILRHGALTVDPRRHTVSYGDTFIELTHREFLLLQTLLENKSIVLRRDTLLEKVWGYDYAGETNVVDVYVHYLRSKIDDVFGIKLIQTVRGVGYVIKEELP